MSIQWFPGHMHRARKAITSLMREIDVIIEVMDARLPESSRNPLIRQLRRDKPSILVLNKADLADPNITKDWVNHFNQEYQTTALAISAYNPKECHSLIDRCQSVMPHKVKAKRPIRTMIMGIPNVGKSSLINRLAGKTVAKSGNLPALTRQPQMIRLEKGIILFDTPGLLWPKIDSPYGGARLAASGAIRDTALDLLDVGLFATEHLVQFYSDRLIDRYRLPKSCIESLLKPELSNLKYANLKYANPEHPNPEDVHSGHSHKADIMSNPEMWLEAIAERRGCLIKGGEADLYKASEIVLSELRLGKLGRISLETPQQISVEQKLFAEHKLLEEHESLEKHGLPEENQTLTQEPRTSTPS